MNAVPQKGSEMNLTLGGIDLNNSGSVVVKADKKLLTVLFPDGRDGRAFTLKAETLEDLYEWKAALDEALAQSPSATLVVGQNGIFRNDQTDAFDGSVEQKKQPVKSLVIGRPILLALEDIDGTPSFLEKALRFVEVHGVKVEGILRQAADVDDVEHRIREYEQGKINFSPEEDAHVIADCVKVPSIIKGKYKNLLIGDKCFWNSYDYYFLHGIVPVCSSGVTIISSTGILLQCTARSMSGKQIVILIGVFYVLFLLPLAFILFIYFN
ncbi:Rho GTPase-activating protein ren1 [Sarracenia purpurea var. burkii]